MISSRAQENRCSPCAHLMELTMTPPELPRLSGVTIISSRFSGARAASGFVRLFVHSARIRQRWISTMGGQKCQQDFLLLLRPERVPERMPCLEARDGRKRQ
jgi:hypothetical protein